MLTSLPLPVIHPLTHSLSARPSLTGNINPPQWSALGYGLQILVQKRRGDDRRNRLITPGFRVNNKKRGGRGVGSSAISERGSLCGCQLECFS
jgi:hypothetical protein